MEALLLVLTAVSVVFSAVVLPWALVYSVSRLSKASSSLEVQEYSVVLWAVVVPTLLGPPPQTVFSCFGPGWFPPPLSAVWELVRRVRGGLVSAAEEDDVLRMGTDDIQLGFV